MANPNLIYPGQKLVIPDVKTAANMSTEKKVTSTKVITPKAEDKKNTQAKKNEIQAKIISNVGEGILFTRNAEGFDVPMCGFVKTKKK